MVEVFVESEQLILGDTTLEFGAPITDHVEYNEFVVVRLKTTRKEYANHLRNVIAVDYDGTIRWKLPKLPQPDPAPYTNIFTKTGDDLWVHNFSGLLYQVDPNSGEIIDKEFVK